MFASLVMVFSDLALGAALIQRKDAERGRPRHGVLDDAGGRRRSSPCVGVALSGPIASLYGEPDAQPLLLVLSLSFVVSALGATQQNLMLRDMDFRRVEVLTMIGGLVGGVAAVAAAVSGAGAWAIIAQQVVAVSSTTALVVEPLAVAAALRLLEGEPALHGGFSAYMLGQRVL